MLNINESNFSKATHLLTQIRYSLQINNGGLQAACIERHTQYGKSCSGARRESPNGFWLWGYRPAFHVKCTRMSSRDLADSQIHNAKPQRASIRSTFGSSPNERCPATLDVCATNFCCFGRISKQEIVAEITIPMYREKSLVKLLTCTGKRLLEISAVYGAFLTVGQQFTIQQHKRCD